MASSDEEDLQALRNAALASMKLKQSADESPQGIQVVRSLTSLQSPEQLYPPTSTEQLYPSHSEHQLYPSQSENQLHVYPPQSVEQQFYPPTSMGQLYPPQHMGQLYPPHSVEQLYPPQNVGQLYQPQVMGQLYQPQAMGQLYQPQEAFIPQKMEEQFGDSSMTFGDVPADFQQVVFQQQNWGQNFGRGNFRGRGFQGEGPSRGRGFQAQGPSRGRGFQAEGTSRGRGFQRGRGRGRGFNNFQPQTPPPPSPSPQSSLIVIQVAGSGERQEMPTYQQQQQQQQQQKKKEMKPMLLRPQDKWASSEVRIQESSPPRPKDKSKFGRYNADSDSEEEDEAADDAEDYQEDPNCPETTEYEPEPVEEPEPVSEDDREPDNNSRAEDSESDGYSDLIIETANIADTSNNAKDISEQNGVSLNSNGSEINGVAQSESRIVVNRSDSKTTNDVSAAVNKSAVNNNIDISANKEEELLGDNCDMETSIDAQTGEENKSTNDDNSPKRVVIRNEDSVSNSYGKFSRFNRRSRRHSDSGDESIDDSSDDSVQDRNSVTSPCAKSEVVSSAESEIGYETESELLDIRLSPVKVTKEASPVQEPAAVSRSATASPTLDNPSPTKSPSASPAATSPASSEVSSSSGSASSSASDSESSSRQSSPAPSLASAKHSRSSRDRSLAKTAKDTKKQPLKANSPKPQRQQSESKHSNKSGSPLSSGRHSLSKDTDRRKSSGKKERSVSPSVEKSRVSSSRRRHSPVQGRGAISNNFKSRKFPDNEVVADPEFDAANYRDDSMLKNRSRGHPVTDTQRKESARRSSERKPEVTKDNRDKEVRYFKDIAKLKDDHKRTSKYSADSLKVSTEKIPVAKSKLETKDRRVDERISKGQKADKKVISTSTSAVKDGKHSLSKKENYSRQRSRSISAEQTRKKRKSKSPLKRKSKSPVRNDKIKSSEKVQLKEIKSSRLEDTKSNKRTDRNDKRRKSDEKGSRRKSDEMKHSSKSAKTDDNSRRKSIQEKLKKIAGVDIDSGSESEDSEKSVSSLSDVSSESESGTWRNKKAGVSRDTDDIERERRRRRLQDREKRRDSERGRADRHRDVKGEKREDVRDSYRGGQRSADWGNRARGGRDRVDVSDDRKHSGVQERYHNSKKMVFYDNSAELKKKTFEEVSSDSDSRDKVTRGFVTVVQNEKAKRSKHSGSIPSLMDITVSKPAKQVDTLQKRLKKERLVIQVAQSSDSEEEIVKKKKHKKHSKGKRSRSSEYGSEQDDEWSREQSVNVTFDKDIKTVKSKPSIYERLGGPVSKKVVAGKMPTERAKPSLEVVVPSGGKRIKLGEKGKYRKTGSKQTEGGNDSDLNKHIQKIQAKNAEILRRKKEVEFDKQRYG